MVSDEGNLCFKLVSRAAPRKSIVVFTAVRAMVRSRGTVVFGVVWLCTQRTAIGRSAKFGRMTKSPAVLALPRRWSVGANGYSLASYDNMGGKVMCRERDASNVSCGGTFTSRRKRIALYITSSKVLAL